MPNKIIVKVGKDKSGVVLLEQEKTHKNGFDAVNVVHDSFETRRIPILILSDYFKNE